MVGRDILSFLSSMLKLTPESRSVGVDFVLPSLVLLSMCIQNVGVKHQTRSQDRGLTMVYVEVFFTVFAVGDIELALEGHAILPAISRILKSFWVFFVV